MKKLIIVLFLFVFLFPVICFAQGSSQITFAWDCNPCLDVDGFKLYQTQSTSQPYDPNYPNRPIGIFDINNPIRIIPDPSARSVTIDSVPDGIYYYVATAYEEHIPSPGLPQIQNESAFSNEVRAGLDTLAPSPPHLEFQTIIKMIISGTP